LITIGVNPSPKFLVQIFTIIAQIIVPYFAPEASGAGGLSRPAPGVPVGGVGGGGGGLPSAPVSSFGGGGVSLPKICVSGAAGPSSGGVGVELEDGIGGVGKDSVDGFSCGFGSDG